MRTWDQPGQAAQSVTASKVGRGVMMMEMEMEMEVAGPKQGGKAADVCAVWDEL